MRFEKPYVLRLPEDKLYAMECTLWHGEALETATELPLHRGSSNQGRALVFNWPGAGDDGRVIVSRLIGMSLLLDAGSWATRGFGRFNQGLVVHHLDHCHENCFLGNLAVEERGPHVGQHNRER